MEKQFSRFVVEILHCTIQLPANFYIYTAVRSSKLIYSARYLHPWYVVCALLVDRWSELALDECATPERKLPGMKSY